jgi:pyruvate kinase
MSSRVTTSGTTPLSAIKSSSAIDPNVEERHHSTIDQQDAGKNNILFETWTSNVAKMNMERDFVRKLGDDEL